MGGSVRASVRGAGGSGGGPGSAPVRENAGFSYLSADSGVAFFSSFSGGSPGSRSSSSQCSRRPRGGAVEPGGGCPEMRPVCFLQPSHAPGATAEHAC